MGDTVAELNALVATIPKQDADVDIKAALDAIDPDAQKTKLQKQLREERGRTTRLSKELDDARDKIAGQAALISMFRVDDAPLLTPTPGSNKRAEDAELRATKAERRVEELEIDVHALTQQIAFHRNAAKDDRATIMHERDHARASEQQVRDTKKATEEDVTHRVAVQIAKVKNDIHSGGFKDGYRAAMDAPEVQGKRAKRAAEQAAQDAWTKAYDERVKRILAAGPQPPTPEMELRAAIEAGGE